MCEDMLLSLKNFSGEQGEVHDYQYDNDDNSFTATIRAKTDQNEDLQFYSDWCSDWIGKFSKGTATNWIVRYTYPTAKKYLYRKVFKCHHNNFDKLKKRKREDTRQRGKYCNATIGILFKKVNRDTIRNDCLLNKGLNVVIQITFKHSHRIVVAEAYSYLRMSVDTETIFLKYFEDGMTASAARSFHEIYLESEHDESEISLVLANAQINPTERQVKYLYTKWRNANFGGREYPDMLNALKSKLHKYTEKGAKVIIQENPLIIVVLTPIMIRAHNHQFANEIVFVDSSGSCDQTNTCVTFFFGATKVGAVPLACILHTDQSQENYTGAFALLRDSLQNEGFGSFGFPKIFMTDDSLAERNALKHVFPESLRLLCIFHLCQALWRWLWHNQHGILKDDRKYIMAMFRNILYSTSIEQAQDNYDTFLNDEKIGKYDNLKLHISNYWNRREEWLLAYRSSLLTRGNNTNNYVEASIRVFKDIVLQRCKAFNTCALIDFVIKVFESYQRRHLLTFANCRSSKNELAFLKMASRASMSTKKIDENTYLVSSENDDGVFYTTYIDIAFCDCIYGQGGRFCKHLCAIQNTCGIRFNTCKQLNADDRKQLAQLALGDDVPTDFYKDMIFTENVINNNTTLNNPELHQKITDDNHYTVEEKHFNNITEMDFNAEHSKAVTELSSNFDRLTDMASNGKTVDMINGLTKWNKILSKINTPLQLINFIHSSKNFTSKKNISVQPTSVSRRKIRPGLTSGAKRIEAGRPSKHERKKNGQRKRSLAVNVDLNRPNAKSHGTGH